MADQLSSDDFLSFGPFRLFPAQRLLFEGDQPVALGSRAMELLIALVTRRGELMSKQELMNLAWPDTTVVEANVAVNIGTLREAIGDGRDGARYIVNSPGRGYRFVAPVTVSRASLAGATLSETAGAAIHNIPARLTRLIGREAVVGRLVERLETHRLLTIVGPGGIGKTAVALEVAEACTPLYRDGVWLVDFAPIADSRLVPAALASTLKLQIRSDEPIPDLVDAVRDKQMLLVLDNCEHVIDTAATLAASVLIGAREVRILATTREPLRTDGEQVHRLPPLDSPPAALRLSASHALDYPAVQLFVERTAASISGFELSDDDATSAGEICRQLDGVPLAIEFAAARVITLGVRGIATQLHDGLKLLTGGRRTAAPRHQTISAVLDWSYRLLSAAEQMTLRRLAVFAGGFTLDAARKVINALGPSEDEVAENLQELVAKSLVTADPRRGQPRFRLLETTRAYAWAELANSGERDELGRRHAEYYLRLLEAVRQRRAPSGNRAQLEAVAGELQGELMAAELDNIRAALSWSFSPEGDARIGVALSAASASGWLQLGLLPECRAWMSTALESLDTESQGSQEELVIRSALASALFFTGPVTLETYRQWEQTGIIAEHLDDLEHQNMALVVMWTFHIRPPDYDNALKVATRWSAVAARANEAWPTALASWSMGCTEHHLGHLDSAQAHLEKALGAGAAEARQWAMGWTGFDVQVDVLGILSTLYWLRGFPGKGLSAAEECRSLAAASGLVLPACDALMWTGFDALLAGDSWSALEACAVELVSRASENALLSFSSLGHCFMGSARMAQGDSEAGARSLSEGLAGLEKAQYGVFRPFFTAEFARALAAQGLLDKGLAAIEALERTEPSPEHWLLPHVLRRKGEILLGLGRRDLAEEHLRRSLEWARRQNADLWELRSALTLCELSGNDRRSSEDLDQLAGVVERFSDGVVFADLTTARTLLGR